MIRGRVPARLHSMARRYPPAVAWACALVVAGGVSACTSTGGRTASNGRVAVLARTVADTVSTELLAPGVQLHRLVNITSPWRASVLDVDLAACVSVRSVKGGPVAVGRVKTSALLTSLDPALRPVAAVNADFFSFTPPGVPVNAHVENGRLLSGPIERPVFAMTAAGRAWIGRLLVTGQLQTARATIPLVTWNRPTAGKVGIVDAAWGIALDSIVARTAWVLAPIVATSRVQARTARAVAPNARPANSSAPSDQRYLVSPLSRTRSSIVTGDTLLLVGARAAATGSVAVPMAISAGDTVRVSRTLEPFMPTTAVGGQPQLLRASAFVGAVDSVNDAAFRGLNPRTAIGYADRGRRLLLVVVDGRQPGYSMGMSLRQTAELFRALGATDALNLDGGGSSAMVVTDPRAPTRTRFVTHPSDSAGERPVANALAVLRSCR